MQIYCLHEGIRKFSHEEESGGFTTTGSFKVSDILKKLSTRMVEYCGILVNIDGE